MVLASTETLSLAQGGDRWSKEDCDKLLRRIAILDRQARSQIADFKAVDDVNAAITNYGYLATGVDTAAGMATAVRGFFKNFFKSKRNWDNLAPRENFPAYSDLEFSAYKDSLYRTSAWEAAGSSGVGIVSNKVEGYIVAILGFDVINRLSDDLWMRSDAFAKELELNLKDTQYEQGNLQSLYDEHCK